MHQLKKIILTLISIICLLEVIVHISACDSEPLVRQGKAYQKANFTVQDNRIYALDNDRLIIYKLNQGIITYSTTTPLDYYVESIFSTPSLLFLSFRSSFIYDISIPDNPEYLSTYSNLYSCDRIAFTTDYLFSTKNLAQSCRNSNGDKLEILNLSALPQELLTTYNITSPQSLSISEQTLFVCSSTDGLSIFSIQDPTNITLIKNYSSILGKHVFSQSGKLFVTHTNTIDQYDYTDLLDLKFLSSIPIN